MMPFYHIKNRFAVSIVPGWLQQWALGPAYEETTHPASVVTEGFVSVGKKSLEEENINGKRRL